MIGELALVGVLVVSFDGVGLVVFVGIGVVFAVGVILLIVSEVGAAIGAAAMFVLVAVLGAVFGRIVVVLLVVLGVDAFVGLMSVLGRVLALCGMVGAVGVFASVFLFCLLFRQSKNLLLGVSITESPDLSSVCLQVATEWANVKNLGLWLKVLVQTVPWWVLVLLCIILVPWCVLEASLMMAWLVAV